MKYFFFAILFLLCLSVSAQKDSLVVDSTGRIASSKSNIRITKEILPVKPAVAIRRSAIIPGWGQATNKSYWKIPVIYAALGTTTYLFFRNLKQFREARDAYRLASDLDTSNDYLIKQPYYTVRNQPDRIRNFRDGVRQNVDYSALFFIIFWGLNVVDAAVEAHMKNFDVSDNLSLQFKPGYSGMARTNGVSLILHIK